MSLRRRRRRRAWGSDVETDEMAASDGDDSVSGRSAGPLPRRTNRTDASAAAAARKPPPPRRPQTTG